MGQVLLVKLGAIGDVVMLLPAARALYEQGNTVEWLCGRQVAPLLALYPWITTVVADETAILSGSFAEKTAEVLKLWRCFAGRRYDFIGTLNYDWRYRLLTRTARAKRRLFLSGKNRDARLLPGRNYSDEYVRLLLGLPDDVRPESYPPVRPESLPRSPVFRAGSAPRIVLIPGGARNLVREDSLRRWPLDNFVALAKRLLGMGYEVLLSGGPGDTWVSEAFRGCGVNDCVGRHNLVETVALLDSSDVVVTHDTGPLHLAGITRASIVAIFGPTSPKSLLPRRPGSMALWGGELFACRPCYDGKNYANCHDNQCVKQVRVEHVLVEVEHQLALRRGDDYPEPLLEVSPGTIGPEILYG